MHLRAWFAREQHFKAHFCEVDVRNNKVAKCNVWSPKFVIFSTHEDACIRGLRFGDIAG
jgi:hypothetical protein